MTKNAIVSLLLFLFSLKEVYSQTVTVADPNVPGGSIIEVSTLNIQGIPTVSIIESIPPGAPVLPGVPTTSPLATTATTATSTTSISTPTSTSTTTSTTPPPAPVAPPVGPVGAPPQTTIPVGEGTTLFTFTTVVDGATEILTGTFTPTFNTLAPPPPPSSGTILGLSQFLSTAAVSSAQSPQRLGFSTSNTVTIFTILCGVTAGALLTM